MLIQFRNFLNALPRGWKQAILIVFDAVALAGVLWLSYSLRLGPSFISEGVHHILMATAPIVAIPVFIRFGLYRAVIRYLPERALWTILQAMFVATLLWVFLLFLAEATRFGVLPRTIPIFYFLLGTIVIGGSRFAAKYLLWMPATRGKTKLPEVAIYGAGPAGAQLATALRSQGGGFVSAFLDEDRSIQGRDVLGVRVYAPSYLGKLIADHGVKEVIISIPESTAAERERVYAELSKYPVKVRTLPAITDLATGKYVVSQLREIDIDDLLGRSSVPADPELLKQMIEGRTILVSGAGGSIGSELCRIIVGWQPKKLVLFEANEFALYEIERALNGGAGFPIVPVLGSVTDARLVKRTLANHEVEVVFHAAAHKHVPLVEANPLEGVRNNVLGTRTIAAAALEGGVQHFVLISTDKAVRPTNVMGASKRWAELVVHSCAEEAARRGTGQRFSAVRFGNVLGSNGSVVPLFREQIAKGGPVTLTDEAMTRYFMSIHEAAELIVQAGALAEGGDLFLLEMGEPVKIRSLAENMIRLAGLTERSPENPGGDIEIQVTGSRPGEKMFEELFYDPSQASRTRQPKILRSLVGERSNGGIHDALAGLTRALDAEDEAELRRLLFDFIRE
ncbi:MAG TPA: nucleoside-diphosphate sugar epimerase/dehydratase [Devosia sp.]